MSDALPELGWHNLVTDHLKKERHLNEAGSIRDLKRTTPTALDQVFWPYVHARAWRSHCFSSTVTG